MVFILAGINFHAKAQTAIVPQDGTFYIVRHAEKDTGRNPILSLAGQKRAGDLYRRLEKEHILQVYSTSFRRTQMTGDSLHFYQNTEQLFYKVDTTGDGMMEALAAHFKNNTAVLIIGHSNTVPALLTRLGVNNLNGYEIPESQYHNLFIVEIKKGKVIRFLQEQYGSWAL